MIENSKILSLEFYNYKGIFTGSLKGMRYRIEKVTKEEEQAVFLAHAWKEPYNFEVTPKEEMEKKEFEFSEEGKQEMVEWLNILYGKKYGIKQDEKK